MEGNTAIINSNEHSCIQNAFINGAKALGIAITKTQVYDETLPLQGDTEVSAIVKYAHGMGIAMLDCRVRGTTSKSETMFRTTKGGPEHALLQFTTGVFYVEVRISHAALLLIALAAGHSLTISAG